VKEVANAMNLNKKKIKLSPEELVKLIEMYYKISDRDAWELVKNIDWNASSFLNTTNMKEGHPLGASHGMVGQNDVPPERDQLTDPIYTGKKPFKGGEIKEERAVTTPLNYEFRSFKWLANKDGFNYPVDVKYGTVYLGLLVAKPDGYIIKLVDTPTGKKDVKESPRNKFKSEQLAAAALHKLWQWNRTTKA